MPAEWEPHASTWLSWPSNEVTWPGERLERVRESYVKMIRLLSFVEQVDLLVDDEEARDAVRTRLSAAKVNLNSVRVHVIPTVDGWIRDYGPNFLVNRRRCPEPVAYNNWGFNAWGGKYEGLAHDDRIPDQLSDLLRLPEFRPGLILEGGSIEVNGAGLCLTTRQCLLNPNRNPHLSQAEIERAVMDYLGVKRILWLDEGIIGDDTDGHIDDIARFTDSETVACAVESDPSDANYPILKTNLDLLQAISRQEGLFRVVELPMPEPVYAEGDRLPASYVNFYVANGLVLVPVFGQARDREALTIIECLFPERDVIGISASEMVFGLGAVHCLTQQQPAAVP
jgi:agmatine deiminase